MKEKVGQVTEEEKNEIKQLFERQNGLNELAQIVTPANGELYEKMLSDRKTTQEKFDRLWDRLLQKNRWTQRRFGFWKIDFDTNDIYLERKKKWNDKEEQENQD